MLKGEEFDIDQIVGNVISLLNDGDRNVEVAQDRWCQITAQVLSSLPGDLADSVRLSPERFRATLYRAVISLIAADSSFCELLRREDVATSSSRSIHIHAPQNSGIVFGSNSGSVAGGNIVGIDTKAPVAPGFMEDRKFGRGAPIRILFLGSSPEDLSHLRLDQEARQIDLALRAGEYRDHFTLFSHWAVRPSDLQTCLLRHRPHIIHFSGHGSDSQAIFLEDDSGRRYKVAGDVLARLLAIFKSSVRCVVLNACYSADQAQAIAQQIDCVVGMSVAVGDKAAISFAAAFYQALAFGCNVASAFELGCVQVGLDGEREEANTPRLIALRQDASKIVFAE